MQQYLRLLIILVVAIVVAIMPVSGEKEQTLTIDQLLHMENPGPFSLSHDGQNLVYLKSEGTDLSPEYTNGSVILIDLRSKAEHTLSGSSETVVSFALSPDGTQVAYAAVQDDSGETLLKVVSLADLSSSEPGNVPAALLSGFSWLNVDELLYLDTNGTGTEVVTAGYPDDTIIVDETPEPVILRKYSLKTEATVPVSANDDVITLYSPSPDGRYILYKSAPYPEEWRTGALFRYVILNTVTGAEETLFTRTEGYEEVNALAWEPDSSVVYIERMQNGGMDYPIRYTTDVLACYPDTGEIQEVPMKWEKGLHVDLFNEDVEINPFNGGFYAMLADGANPKIAVYRRTGSDWEMQVLSGMSQGNIFALESSADGSEIVYDFNSADTPPQLYSAKVKGGVITDDIRLTNLNTEILPRLKGESEVVRWEGALGDDVEGIVRYPPGYEEGTGYPLVLVVHGGPTYTDFDSWRDTWEFPYHLISDLGAVLLSVNYHGSQNYGFDFAGSIENNHYYDLPIRDLLTGKEYLAKKGIIDPDRTGATGWSNGGILILDLITRDTSIKAAVAGAGTAEDQAQTALTNGIVMTKMYYGDSPYQNPDMYLDILPIYRAENVKTPLLMIGGTEDQAVEPAAAMVTYRTYAEESQAPVRFIRFPGEGHHPKQYVHQYRKVQEELDWLEKYLLA